VQNQDAYMQSVAGQRPYFFEHIRDFTDQCMAEYAQLTGRQYARVTPAIAEDAEYLILGHGFS
jgi:pyruvate-ferredoxin/flavodoxin oxidoreductase